MAVPKYAIPMVAEDSRYASARYSNNDRSARYLLDEIGGEGGSAWILLFHKRQPSSFRNPALFKATHFTSLYVQGPSIVSILRGLPPSRPFLL
jgi:hypothetical protein